MLSRFTALRRLTAIKLPQLTQTAGLQSFEDRPNYDHVEFPERARLPMYPKVPQYPNNIKPFKMQKRIRYMRGPEELHNELQHKQFGIVAVLGGRLKHGHFEMIRMTIGRKLPDKAFAVYRVPAPWQPISKKGHGVRMGGGKSAINHYVTPLKSGRVIVEVGGHIEFIQVKKVMEEVASKLPFEAKVVTYESMQRDKEKEEWMEKNNQNYWTYKYIVQNNLLGCSKWICPSDRLWFGKHR